MKNIIFDLGGVVVDWNPEKLLREYPGDPAMPIALFERGFFQQYWTEFDRGTLTQVELVQAMNHFVGCPYAEAWDFVEYIKHTLHDIPETQQLIKELFAQGYRLFCLSNMSVEFYDYLKDREIFNYFDGKIISALKRVVKPEKEIYRLLVERYGIIPQESLFIDDLVHNVEAAGQLDFHTVHFVDREKGISIIKEQLFHGCAI